PAASRWQFSVASERAPRNDSIRFTGLSQRHYLASAGRYHLRTRACSRWAFPRLDALRAARPFARPSHGDPSGMKRVHQMPFGAEVLSDGVRFRIWAPSVERIGLSLEGPEISKVLPMDAAGDGWFENKTVDARPGSRYRFVLEN